ncbi:MAG: polysaccharide deacetylase family protein [Candidatus Omnitrophota bacterium]
MRIKQYLSKLNFFMGNSPRILSYPKNTVSKFIPFPHKAGIIISCDFELIWAWRFAKQISCDLEKAKEITIEERANIPFILDICEEFNIPLTFATVGHLFLERCERENGVAHPNIKRLKYFENRYWKFSSGDWFDDDPCCNWASAQGWYAPDLIGRILNSKVKHEIACHTFSHIDCRDEVCSPEILKQEIRECKNLASKCGIKLDSFVFPANLTGNLRALKEEGFSSFRTDEDVLGFPKKNEYGLWQFPTTAQIGVSSYKWSIEYYIKRYKTIIERAMKHQRLCHFWFHPSTSKRFLEPVLTELFQFIDSARSELYVTTMGAYASYLEDAKF